MRRFALVPGLLMIMVSGLACSGGASPGGSGGQGNKGGSGSGSGGMTGAGSGGSTASCGSTTGGTGGAPYTMLAACGELAMATATTTTFEGTDTYYLRDNEGLGDDICQVKFDIKRVGAAPTGCPDCLWSHQIEFSNPMVVLDKNGVCAKSDLAFSMAKINCTTGSKIAVGFVKEFLGAHASVLMKYSEATSKWEQYSNATWDETTHAFRFDSKNGACNY